MILLSHPTGNANVREAARALNEAGMLSEFWTSLSWNQRGLLNHMLPRFVGQELERRAFSHIGQDKLHCHPWIEAGRLTMRQLNIWGLPYAVGKFSIEAAYPILDSRGAVR